MQPVDDEHLEGPGWQLRNRSFTLSLYKVNDIQASSWVEPLKYKNNLTILSIQTNDKYCLLCILGHFVSS